MYSVDFCDASDVSEGEWVIDTIGQCDEKCDGYVVEINLLPSAIGLQRFLYFAEQENWGVVVTLVFFFPSCLDFF